VNFAIERFIVPALLLGLRVAGLMTFAPFFASTGISVSFRAGLTVALTVLLYPVCGPHIAFVSLSPSGWVRIVLSEAVLGFLMGLCVQLVFEGAQLAGQIVGIQMGFSLVNIIDPQTQVDTTVVSAFNQTVVLLIFLQLGVHRWILRALALSFDLAPVGSLHLSTSSMRVFFHAAAAMWVIGVQIAAPILIATVIVDLILNLLSKASPQLPVLFFTVSIKMLLGVALLVGALAFWPGFFQSRFTDAVSFTDHFLRVVR
jgi:flagellar biosynthesis protein FliR